MRKLRVSESPIFFPVAKELEDCFQDFDRVAIKIKRGLRSRAGFGCLGASLFPGLESVGHAAGRAAPFMRLACEVFGKWATGGQEETDWGKESPRIYIRNRTYFWARRKALQRDGKKELGVWRTGRWRVPGDSFGLRQAFGPGAREIEKHINSSPPGIAMAITLTPAEEDQIAAQTWQDAEVIMSFCEWLRHFKEQHADDVTACRLALGKQKDTFQEVYAGKVALYLRELRKNQRFRLRRLKRIRPGRRFMTKSGVRVRSKIEKIIADFLTDKKIRFTSEPILDLNGFCVMPDFHLDDFGLCIEHFGLETPGYKESAKAKLNRYERFGVRVVCTYPSDEPDIEEILTRKLRQAGVLV